MPIEVVAALPICDVRLFGRPAKPRTKKPPIVDLAISEQASVVPASRVTPGAAGPARCRPWWHSVGAMPSPPHSSQWPTRKVLSSLNLPAPGGGSRGCMQKGRGPFHLTTSPAKVVRFALNLDNGRDEMDVSGLVRLNLAADRLGCHSRPCVSVCETAAYPR